MNRPLLEPSVEHARLVVRRVLEAADNGNQAGENGVVLMAAAGALQLTLENLLHLLGEGCCSADDDEYPQKVQTAINAGWAALGQAVQS